MESPRSGTALPTVTMGPQTNLPTEETAPLTEEVLSKLHRLETLLATRRAVLVAYSGGVDSALIAAVAVRAVGPWDPSTGQGALAALADSSTLARRELHLARATADDMGIPLEEVRYSEFDNPEWSTNDARRCYHCKKDLAAALRRLAPEWGFGDDQVAYGITVSDLGDHRPGIKATEESAGWHPLVEAGITKPEVRALAKHLGLPVWDKPATPCLASRVQYGERIREETLQRVEAAEEAMRALGFRVFRVRNHDRLARVEVPTGEIGRAIEVREEIVAALRAVGYTYVTLDLLGFRSGAMNEALVGEDEKGASPPKRQAPA